MSETTPEAAPELADPIGVNGAGLMGIATPPVNVPEPVTVSPTLQTPAELRAAAEQMLTEADKLEAAG